MNMMKRLLLILVLLALSVPVSAQWRYVLTLADVTVTGTAASVFSATDVRAGNGHVQATLATCTLVTANIRVAWDGTVPTTSLGQVLVPGAYVIQGTDVLLGLQAIRDDAVSGVLSCVLSGQ